MRTAGLKSLAGQTSGITSQRQLRRKQPRESVLTIPYRRADRSWAFRFVAARTNPQSNIPTRCTTARCLKWAVLWTSNLERQGKATLERRQNAEKPRSRPLQATLRPSGSQPLGTPKPPRSHLEATLRLYSGYLEATPRHSPEPVQSHLKATVKHMELGMTWRRQAVLRRADGGRIQGYLSATADFTLSVHAPFQSLSRLPARDSEGGEFEHDDWVIEFHRVGHAHRTST